jgi:hypothetical protein
LHNTFFLFKKQFNNILQLIYSVSRICEIHLGFVWERGKGKREKAVPHGSENCYECFYLTIELIKLVKIRVFIIKFFGQELLSATKF